MLIKTKSAPASEPLIEWGDAEITKAKQLHLKKSFDLASSLSFEVSPFMGVFDLNRPAIEIITLDIETTGLDSAIHGIWEIGAALVRIEFDGSPTGYSLEVLDAFESMVRPWDECIYDDTAARYNGYPDARYMYRSSKIGKRKHYHESVVAAGFMLWLSNVKLASPDAQLIAHYAEFETGFFKALDNRNGTQILAQGRLQINCTKQLFQFLKLFGVANTKQSTNLDALTKYYSLPPKEGTAFSDALRCAQVLAEQITSLRAAMGILEALAYTNSDPANCLTTTDLLGRDSNLVECLVKIVAGTKTEWENRRATTYFLCLNTLETDINAGKFRFAVVKYPMKLARGATLTDKTMSLPDAPQCKTLAAIVTLPTPGVPPMAYQQDPILLPPGFANTANFLYEYLKASCQSGRSKDLADIADYAKAYLPAHRVVQGTTADAMEQVARERVALGRARRKQYLLAEQSADSAEESEELTNEES